MHREARIPQRVSLKWKQAWRQALTIRCIAGQSQSSAPANPHADADQTSAASLRNFFLPGQDGRLEALLNQGRPDAPYATLLCHPHPKGGGTMHNKVVYHAAKVFSALGWPVLRFNFRGTGLSEGQHDGNREVDDVRTGLDWLAREYNKPIVAAGFSFGSVMGLEACSTYATVEIAGFAALGLPTESPNRSYSYPFLQNCSFPKLFLSGDRDQFAPVESLRAVVAAAPPPTQFSLIANADHFFTGHLQSMQAVLNDWLSLTYPRAPISTPEIPHP